MANNQGNLPSVDEGETGISEIDQMITNNFVSQYRIGKALVAGLTAVMVASLGISVYVAVEARPVAEVQKNEKTLEGRDLDILSECLPNCYFEDIYSMNSVAVPLVAAREILPRYVSIGDGRQKAFLWEDMVLHDKISQIVKNKESNLETQLSEGSIHRQSIIFMVSHFLSRAEENALERGREVGELCERVLGKGTCIRNAKPAMDKINKVVDIVRSSKDSILGFVRSGG